MLLMSRGTGGRCALLSQGRRWRLFRRVDLSTAWMHRSVLGGGRLLNDRSDRRSGLLQYIPSVHTIIEDSDGYVVSSQTVAWEKTTFHSKCCDTKSIKRDVIISAILSIIHCTGMLCSAPLYIALLLFPAIYSHIVTELQPLPHLRYV